MNTLPNCNGYKRYINSTVGDTYKHRLVAEATIKRKLKKGEVVHHKDENRENNDPNNLLVFHNNANHNRYHQCEYSDLKQLEDKSWICIQLKFSKTCPHCNKDFESTEQDKKYCSKKCSGLHRRKAIRPQKNILEELVWEMPTSKISQLYGVSDVAISKWCKIYNIPKPPRGYWAKRHAKQASIV